MTTAIAALYVDVKRGPYAALHGVDAWGVERDATLYTGPWPVVAHPPCGHWGRYAHKAHDDGHTGSIAVDQVRTFGGVLEHPRDSKLWRLCGMPRPGELPDEWGGWTLQIEQGDFGHRAQKSTWLYIVGTTTLPPFPPRRPPPVQKPKRDGTMGKRRGQVELMSRQQRHLTPHEFAIWLCTIAARCAPRRR